MNTEIDWGSDLISQHVSFSAGKLESFANDGIRCESQAPKFGIWPGTLQILRSPGTGISSHFDV